MIDIDTLIKRCRDRSEEEGDYWDGSAKFLATIRRLTRAQLSQKQRNWLHGLRQDLWEPGD